MLVSFLKASLSGRSSRSVSPYLVLHVFVLSGPSVKGSTDLMQINLLNIRFFPKHNCLFSISAHSLRTCPFFLFIIIHLFCFGLRWPSPSIVCPLHIIYIHQVCSCSLCCLLFFISNKVMHQSLPSLCAEVLE